MSVENKSYYEIQETLLSLWAEAEENEGVLTPEMEAKFAIAEKDLEHKIKGYRWFIKKQQADQKLISEEAQRLYAKNRSKEALIDRLKSTLVTALQLFGETTDKGNSRLRYPDLTVWTQDTNTVEWDQDKLNEFIEKFGRNHSDIHLTRILKILDKFVTIRVTIETTPSRMGNILQVLDMNDISNQFYDPDEIVTSLDDFYTVQIIPDKSALKSVIKHANELDAIQQKGDVMCDSESVQYVSDVKYTQEQIDAKIVYNTGIRFK